MKKLSVLALITAVGIAGSTVLPAQAANPNNMKNQLKANGYAVIGGKVSSPEDLKNMISDLCNGNFNWKDCPEVTPPSGNVPDTDKPGDGDQGTDVPDTEKPGEDSNKPGTDGNKPGGDGNNPGGDSQNPGTGNDKPGTDNENPDPGTQERTYAEQVVDLVNAERAKAGLGALTLDKGIESAALVRSKEIETSFSHTRPNGSSFSTVLTENGITFRGSGENIAWGQRSPEDVMKAWMNSDGHRANILNSKFTKIGVGYYQNSAGRNYWTQLFTY